MDANFKVTCSSINKSGSHCAIGFTAGFAIYCIDCSEESFAFRKKFEKHFIPNEKILVASQSSGSSVEAPQTAPDDVNASFSATSVGLAGGVPTAAVPWGIAAQGLRHVFSIVSVSQMGQSSLCAVVGNGLPSREARGAAAAALLTTATPYSEFLSHDRIAIFNVAGSPTELTAYTSRLIPPEKGPIARVEWCFVDFQKPKAANVDEVEAAEEAAEAVADRNADERLCARLVVVCQFSVNIFVFNERGSRLHLLQSVDTNKLSRCVALQALQLLPYEDLLSVAPSSSTVEGAAFDPPREGTDDFDVVSILKSQYNTSHGARISAVFSTGLVTAGYAKVCVFDDPTEGDSAVGEGRIASAKLIVEHSFQVLSEQKDILCFLVATSRAGHCRPPDRANTANAVSPMDVLNLIPAVVQSLMCFAASQVAHNIQMTRVDISAVLRQGVPTVSNREKIHDVNVAASPFRLFRIAVFGSSKLISLLLTGDSQHLLCVTESPSNPHPQVTLYDSLLHSDSISAEMNIPLAASISPKPSSVRTDTSSTVMNAFQSTVSSLYTQYNHQTYIMYWDVAEISPSPALVADDLQPNMFSQQITASVVQHPRGVKEDQMSLFMFSHADRKAAVTTASIADKKHVITFVKQV